ncbi:hypothetical protein SD70_16645 [Gordoniibacillus kamchatkensis]|uniref:Uncharacterized protein n=2 Tax=Gordoniibacillus kamchatkensis TaxID=1590651 RepID=A0ABR5AI13_9BACL|nr:hypothetical protein SD70_16645 [Paenibacillus sp. VKM B-2647]
MSIIRHHNYRSENGEIYCCLRNRVVKLDDEQLQRFCQGCGMFAGTMPHVLVSCDWDDIGGVSNPHVALDPWQEFKRNQIKQVPAEGSAALQRCS